jgi:hypothetical protein
MSSYYKDAFFEDPYSARAEIAAIVQRLRVGCERLAATYTAVQGPGNSGR